MQFAVAVLAGVLTSSDDRVVRFCGLVVRFCGRVVRFCGRVGSLFRTYGTFVLVIRVDKCCYVSATVWLWLESRVPLIEGCPGDCG